MTISHLLETFEETSGSGPLGLSLEDSRADAELALFESAYKAGWDDCHKAAQSSGTALSEDFSQNLRELSFTYQEAHTALIRSIEPLVVQLVTSVLPDLADANLPQSISAEVGKIAKSHAGSELVITCHPSKQSMLRNAMPGDLGLKLSLAVDGGLPESQITLRFSGNEREIDTRSFAEHARALIHSYFDDLKKEPKNG